MSKIFNFKDRQKIVFLTVFALLVSMFGAESRDINPKISLRDKFASTPLSAVNPVVDYTAHNRGNIQLAIANNGSFGTLGGSIPDPFTSEQIPSCIYPKNSNIVYLWVGALWIGAVVGRDTLVSVANEDFYVTTEFWPEVKPFGDFKYKSIAGNSAFYSEDAYSEEDILCEYTDTITDPNLVAQDPYTNKTHQPLNVKVNQRSMAWSYVYADDFILFDYQIQNIGTEKLKDVYMGIYIDGDVWHVTRNGPEGWNDDIVGFYSTHPAPEGCGFIDTINIAYTADNDGDPENGAWDERSARGVVGARVVRTPSDSLRYTYNWWITNYSSPASDYGPRKLGTEDDPWRDFGSRKGTPQGDLNKYYVMRHNEFDYDLLYTAVDHTTDGYEAPPENADIYAMGYDTRYLLSFGPFEINPGEKLPITFAWVGGENLHVNPGDFGFHNPYNPDRFYNLLDFSNLASNSRWASWIYDNPGVDTDGDGYYGKFRVCCYDTALVSLDTNINGQDTTITVTRYGLCDTSYYEGDGVPDFKGASPPPPPEFWVESSVGSLRIRINGIESETSVDQFSKVNDFEGYRVYLSRDDRTTSYSVVASYDIENYNKFVWNENKLPERGYELKDNPFTRKQLQQLYGTPFGNDDFDPLRYFRSSPYIHPLFPDSIFYFEAQDYNACEFGITTPITKKYPDQPYPSSLNPDSAQADELTDDGYFKYFEYELIIENLLPTVPYWVNVTTFDFGSPKSGLKALETSVANGPKVAYPLESSAQVEQENLDAYVYPNPYRIDAAYDETGFENRDGSLATERARLLHFANLPRVCKIYIYSLDGDLVREIDHNYPEGGPESMHQSWDLITRNTQATVTGLYYYVIKSDQRTQIGKFVIIK